MTLKQWAGRAVLINFRRQRTRVPIEILLSEEAARKLALALRKLNQTYVGLEPETQEILTALDYVLVGDPASTAAHGRMEASKGMLPDDADPSTLRPRPLRQTEIHLNQPEPLTDPGLRAQRRRSGEFFSG